MKQAKHCAECQHFAYYVGPLCAKGHKPRFYAPQTHHQAMLGLYGYKRRCEDFKETKDDPTQ